MTKKTFRFGEDRPPNPIRDLSRPGILRSGRETSAEALRQIEEEGLLRKVSLAIYKGLYDHGPCTGGELARDMKREHAKLRLQTPDWLTPRAVRARLGELRDRGAVRELEPRECGVTGRRVIVWDVSGKIPGPKPKKRLSKKDKRIQELEEENARLRARIRELDAYKHAPGLFDRLRS
jgi:hypothetical protein